MTPELLTVLFGALVTPFISWAKMETWSDLNKQRFAIVAAAIAGLLTIQFSPGAQLDLTHYFQAALLATGTNQVAFQAVMKGLGLENLFDILKGTKKPAPPGGTSGGTG